MISTLPEPNTTPWTMPVGRGGKSEYIGGARVWGGGARVWGGGGDMNPLVIVPLCG